MNLPGVMIRIGIAASLAASGISHAYLYVHGYQHIPTIGPSFVIQASVSFALALLIFLGGPAWLQWAAAMLAGGSLVAFALSRTVGLFGFSEQGWQPSPHAAISVGAELLTVALCALYVVEARRAGRRGVARLQSEGGDVSAVDAVVGSGDISGALAGEEDNKVGDFFRSAEPPGR
jgi:drug/metabolite transporter (DMT)-like permease